MQLHSTCVLSVQSSRVLGTWQYWLGAFPLELQQASSSWAAVGAGIAEGEPSNLEQCSSTELCTGLSREWYSPEHGEVEKREIFTWAWPGCWESLPAHCCQCPEACQERGQGWHHWDQERNSLFCYLTGLQGWEDSKVMCCCVVQAVLICTLLVSSALLFPWLLLKWPLTQCGHPWKAGSSKELVCSCSEQRMTWLSPTCGSAGWLPGSPSAPSAAGTGCPSGCCRTGACSGIPAALPLGCSRCFCWVKMRNLFVSEMLFCASLQVWLSTEREPPGTEPKDTLLNFSKELVTVFAALLEDGLGWLASDQLVLFSGSQWSK